jgi:hypothetical protein
MYYGSANSPVTWRAAAGVHAGLVHAAMVDGSVQSINDGVDLLVWRALATRDGAELVSAP